MSNFYEILHFYRLFLPPFSRLDVPLYASRLEERRFLLKSDYPLKRGCLKFAFETAPSFYLKSHNSKKLISQGRHEGVISRDH